MDESASLRRGHPAIVKDENVPLDGRPGEERDLGGVEGVVDVDPDEIEEGGVEHGHAGAYRIQDPDDVGELVDEANDEQHDDDMVMHSSTEGSVSQQTVDHEDGAEDGEGIGDDVGPESECRRETVV